MIDYLKWDSDFFRTSIGSVRDRIESESKLNSMLEEIRKSDLNLVYVTLPINRPDLITRILSEEGAVLVDSRAEMVVDLEKHHSTRANIQSSDFVLRTCEKEDADSAGELASYCFRGLTRFYRDPRFSEKKCDELYRIWAERDIGKKKYLNLIITVEGRTAGFCTVDCTGDETARIGLIGVANDFRGAGMGPALLDKANGMLRERGYGNLVAVTQLSSAGAMRMYERAGFLLRQASIVVHLWQNVEGI